METIYVLCCTWQNETGCGFQIEGAYRDKNIAESMRNSLQKVADKWNKAHPENPENYELEEVVVKA